MTRVANEPEQVDETPLPCTFPIRDHGFRYEDFEVGREFAHPHRRTILESDNALFTTWSLNFVPRHIDREAARAEGHPDIVVNPMLVFATVFGLSVEDLSEHSTAFLGIKQLQYDATVHPGDTLRADSVVTARRIASSGSTGIVTWSTTGSNQRDEPVVSFLRSNLFTLGATA